MLFAIVILVVVVATAIYVSKKTKSSIPTTTVIAPSIHEEIAETVEKIKTRPEMSDEPPIRECIDLVKKEPKTKTVPKMDAKPKTPTKPKAPKKKTVDA
jgi:hypothetical protein